MAKYATVEELWECYQCGIHCAVREMIPDYSKTVRTTRHKCPKCNDVICISDCGYYYRATIRQFLHGNQ